MVLCTASIEHPRTNTRSIGPDKLRMAQCTFQGGIDRSRWTACFPLAPCTRHLLTAAMHKEGFTVFQTEWWHFDHRDWKEYAILDVEFGRIGGK
ncbi:MAG: hypothetical protein IPJ76_13870 [Flavobacteriales bacterium]|nr:MAG: hypothetical protein IPJ76_13870 [Flavobacteriales bacterium]